MTRHIFKLANSAVSTSYIILERSFTGQSSIVVFCDRSRSGELCVQKDHGCAGSKIFVARVCSSPVLWFRDLVVYRLQQIQKSTSEVPNHVDFAVSGGCPCSCRCCPKPS